MEFVNKENSSNFNQPQSLMTNMNNQIMILKDDPFGNQSNLKLSSPTMLLSGTY